MTTMPGVTARWALEGDATGTDAYTDCGLGGDLVKTAAGDEQIRAELLRLAGEVEELQLTVACRDATLAVTVDRLGGEVEGAPTARVNFLQRVDALREIEAERDRLAEENAMLKDALACKSATLDQAEFFGEQEGRAAQAEEFREAERDSIQRAVDIERARIREELLAWLVEPLGAKDAGLAGGRRIVDEIDRICPGE